MEQLLLNGQSFISLKPNAKKISPNERQIILHPAWCIWGVLRALVTEKPPTLCAPLFIVAKWTGLLSARSHLIALLWKVNNATHGTLRHTMERKRRRQGTPASQPSSFAHPTDRATDRHTLALISLHGTEHRALWMQIRAKWIVLCCCGCVAAAFRTLINADATRMK